MGRWANFQSTSASKAGSKPEARDLAARQEIENASELVLNHFEPKGGSKVRPSRNPEARGIPPFLDDEPDARSTFEPSEPFEPGSRDSEIRTNEPIVPKTAFLSDSDKKEGDSEDSLGDLGDPPAGSKGSNGSKPPASDFAQTCEKPVQLNRECFLLRNGRVMYFFRAAEIPLSALRDTAALLDRVRGAGVVLVADGPELHVVERWGGQLHPNTLRALEDNSGAAIAVLRGQHRERVARMHPERVAVYDPRSLRAFSQEQE